MSSATAAQSRTAYGRADAAASATRLAVRAAKPVIFAETGLVV